MLLNELTSLMQFVLMSDVRLFNDVHSFIFSSQFTGFTRENAVNSGIRRSSETPPLVLRVFSVTRIELKKCNLDSYISEDFGCARDMFYDRN